MRTVSPYRQRGAATILAVMFLVVSVSLMVVAALNMAGSDITDTAMHSDAIEALFIAESGVEHASYQYANGTACPDLAGLIGSIGRGSFVITDAALNPALECEVDITATITAPRSVQRRISVTLRAGGNLLASDNADFNDPEVGPGPPTGWTLPAGSWHDTGGPDGSRSAYVVKPLNGPSEVTAAGAYSLSSFTVSAPTTLTMSFDYRVTNGNSPQEMHLTFELRDSNGNVYTHPLYQRGSTGGYASGSVDIAIPGGAPVTITVLEFELVAKAGQAKQIYLDNLVLTDPAGGSSVGLVSWREPVQQ